MLNVNHLYGEGRKIRRGEEGIRRGEERDEERGGER